MAAPPSAASPSTAAPAASDAALLLASEIQDVHVQLHELRSARAAAATAASPASPRTLHRLLVVANRLPLTATRDAQGKLGFKLSSGGLVSALVSVRDEVPFLWLGWLGIEVPAAEQDDVRATLLREHGCVPVFLSDSLAESYYSGFSNDVLWPLLHYSFEPATSNARFDESLWRAYGDANKLFASAVSAAMLEGDLVWVQDYHLMLVPKLLRAAHPAATIAWFLHTPWPTEEVFRLLPTRREVLSSLLSSDLVGFHTHDYARSFLQSCQAVLLNIDKVLPSSIVVRHSARAANVATTTTTVKVSPIGIEPQAFAELAASPATQTLLDEYCRAFCGAPPSAGGELAAEAAPRSLRVIVAVDRLDPIKGVEQRLLGFQALLRRHKEFVGHVVLVQVAVPSRADVGAYKALTAAVNSLVGAINSEFGSLSFTPLQYLYRSVSANELAALYTLADVCAVTSLRDGYNLVSCEFVACQTATCRNRSAPGVLVLSEFAGAAQSLAGALRVNPWCLENIVAVLRRALTMPDLERRLRHEKNARFIYKHTSRTWAVDFVQAIAGLADGRAATVAADADAASGLCGPTFDNVNKTS